MCKHTDSIRSVWADVQPEHLEQGKGWYPEARQLIRNLAQEYGTTEQVAAGVVAALSQRCHWSTNIDRARDVLAGYDEVGGLRLAAEKALLIRDGDDPEEVLGPRAYKVRAFYHALLGDDSATVIDTWILEALAWTKGWYTRLQYDKLADVLRREAAAAGLSVTEYQAIVWCCIRGRSA